LEKGEECIKLIPCRNIQQAEFHRVNCCPSLFEEKMKDIPKRRNIRKARRNRRKNSNKSSLSCDKERDRPVGA